MGEKIMENFKQEGELSTIQQMKDDGYFDKTKNIILMNHFDVKKGPKVLSIISIQVKQYLEAYEKYKKLHEVAKEEFIEAARAYVQAKGADNELPQSLYYGTKRTHDETEKMYEEARELYIAINEKKESMKSQFIEFKPFKRKGSNDPNRENYNIYN